MTPISKPSIVALIPARAGSKRVPGKNTRLLAGKPLLTYTIEAAKASGIFAPGGIIVSTEDAATARLAAEAGAMALDRPAELAADDAPDIGWVRHALAWTHLNGVDAFAILRPTSPFRTAETIRGAWERFKTSSYDSVRAVAVSDVHPGKMWWIDNSVYGGRLQPVIEDGIAGVPWHSCPTQILPRVYRQTAGLEMAWTRVVQADPPTISGYKIGPIVLSVLESLDINTEADWMEAERRMLRQPVEYLG